MGGPLPRSSPGEQQVDAAAVLSFLDTLEAHRDIELHSLMVVRAGHVVAEGWWSPYGPERPHLLYSLSKSFTSTAVGLAQAEGLLDLDDPLLSYFPELDDDIADPRSRRITLRHLAAMASGHTRDVVDEAFGIDPEEPVRGFLSIPPDREPGSVFAYNQPCTYALASVVQRVAGMPLTDYLRPRLFEPLGIDGVGWHARPPGREVGFTGLHARTEDVAKLGLLYLHEGRWGGAQLLSEPWVATATSRQVDSPDEPNPDWRRGYGFQFWMSRHGYRGDGAFGQFCVVLPEHDTVVVTTAQTEQMQAVLDALWGDLLPGLGRSPRDTGAESELARRLDTLRLPAHPDVTGPSDWTPWLRPFAVVREEETGTSHSALTSVEVRRHDGGLLLELSEPDDALTAALAVGDWTVTEPVTHRGSVVPVALTAGSRDEQVLEAAVLFLETPHRLDLTLSLPAGTATATWTHPPLGGDRLEDLHRP